MRILALLVLILAFFLPKGKQTDNPHGPDFKISCSECHSSGGWTLDKKIYSFDHNKTRMPLQGQHTEVNCRQCHSSLVFSEAKTDCNACHNDVHQSTLGMDCGRCHTPASWLVSNIDEIHRMTRFPLVGVHRGIDCYECHKSESNVRFDVPGINCVDCHQADYLATTNPNHKEAGFSDDCLSCHSLNSGLWQGAKFDHQFFPLIQGHASVKCEECHATGRYSDAKPECIACHEVNYQAAKDPDHSGSGFSINCTECHTLTPGWKPANFNHDVFPLVLGHSSPVCTDCHKGADYKSTSPECISCHQQDFNNVSDPNHIEAKFSINCLDCHTLNPNWKPAIYDHSAFPLTLGHSGPLCIDCHKGSYTNTSSTCYSCHQSDFISTTDPNHQASGFSINCLDCHTTNPGWQPATFNHNNFPLTQGHSGVSCAECHKGNYSSTSIDCYSCHSADYLATSNPSHTQLSFSIDCKSCHTTNPGWQPATFTQHDVLFPIYSGHHRGVWNSCLDCHSNPADNSNFTCISCHEHNKTETDGHHRSISGYAYESNACFQCHPRGSSK
ncbi:MAG: hypothetical protein H6538_08265 [Bacteroidales bacterium]|nr:hypothetical protein [Bacteroidales bacterium]